MKFQSENSQKLEENHTVALGGSDPARTRGRARFAGWSHGGRHGSSVVVDARLGSDRVGRLDPCLEDVLGQLVRLRLRAPLSCSLRSGASVRGEGLRSTGRPAGSGSLDGRHHAQRAGPRRRLARPLAGEGAVDLGGPHRDPLDPHSPPLGPPGAFFANHSLPRTLGTFGLPQVRPPYLGKRAEAPTAPQAAAAPGSSRAMLAEPSAQNARRAAAHRVKVRGGAWSWRSASLSHSSSLPRAPVCLASGSGPAVSGP